MNWWGFVVRSSTGRVIFHDYGYDTEKEAQEYGQRFVDEWAEGATFIVNQRWSELEDDPNEFDDDVEDDD